MKKLMVSTIILLPLLILLIMLVSGAIMSLVTHIYVESVEFVENETLVLVLKDEQAPPSAECEVNILPLKASNRGLIFESDDENVVTVDDSGVVKAKFFGETYISVTSEENAAATAKRKVLVTDNEVHYVNIQPFEDVMYNKDTQTLTVSVLPNDAKDQSIEWTSSNPEVLEVSATGILTCHGAKPDKVTDVTITATSKSKPEVSDSVTIHCYQTLDDISLADSATEYTITGREAQFPTVIPTPSNATYTVEYSSDNTALATVDANGKITFTGPGYATITVTASDVKGNKHSKTVSYHCTDGYFEIGSLFPKLTETIDYDEYAGTKAISSLKLNIVQGTSYRQIVGVSYELNGKTYANDGANKFGLIHYDESKNEFTVLSGYNEKLGDVTITVKAKKYSKDSKALIETESDKCTVTVTRKTQSISFYLNGQAISSTDLSSQKSISFKDITLSSDIAKDTQGVIGVLVTPANHTDSLKLGLNPSSEEIATLSTEDIKNGAYLSFNKDKEGTATIAAAAYDGSVQGVSAQLDVKYEAPKSGQVQVKLSSSNPTMSVNLDIFSNNEKNSGKLEFDTPEGMEPKFESSQSEVATVENGVIVPKKGGFATITLSFVPKAQSSAIAYSSEEPQTFTIKVYVDKKVETENLNIQFVNCEKNFTSKENGSYTVTLSGIEADAMEGKQLYVNGSPVALQGLTYTGQFEFEGQDSFDVQAVVKYTAQVAEYDETKTSDKVVCSSSSTVNTTHGKLASGVVPTVKVQGTDAAFSQNQTNNIEFGNIGDQKTLDVTVKCDPADFELTTDKIKFSDAATINDRFTVEIGQPSKQDGSWHATLTLTAKKVISGNETFTLDIAGQKFTVGVTIDALVKNIALSFDEKALATGTTYNTLLKNLTLKVKISRDDNQQITVKTLKYFLDSDVTGKEITVDTLDSGEIKLEGLAAGTHTLTVKAYDKSGVEHVTATYNFKRFGLDELAYDKYYAEYPYSGETKKLDDVDLVTGTTQVIYLPQNHQGGLNVCVKIPTLAEMIGKIGKLSDDNILEGFDLGTSDMSEVFKLVGKADGDDWTTWDNSLTFALAEMEVKCSISFTAGTFANKQLTFTCNGVEVTISLNCASIARIELVGFDSEDDSNGGDVYKGYQQVRVFAKHSYYDNQKVDYFRMPVSAISDTVFNTKVDPSVLTWKLTTYDFASSNEGAPTPLYTLNAGKTFTYKDVEYVIEPVEDGTKPSTLKEKDSQKVIAENGTYKSNVTQVPWIDARWDEEKQEAYVDIYFGEFQGLEEVDVQNDYFGNFGEQAEWTKPDQVQDDSSGRKFTPSDGAFKYLRIEASDGSEGGKSAHFNFNVLQDDALVNVFDAAGYYASSKMALHTNLYGAKNESVTDDGKKYFANNEFNKDEITRTDDNSHLFLTSTGSLGKDLIYGNGYAISYNVMNEELRSTMLSNGTIGNYGGVNIGGAYNVTLRGRNPSESFSESNNGLVFVFKYCYYSNIQYYYKVSPSGGQATYFKNSVINRAIKGIQLYYDGAKAYFENMMIYDCVMAVCCEGTGSGEGHNLTAIFQGEFNDVLNYQTLKSLLETMSKVPLAGFLGDTNIWRDAVAKYAEWLGKTGPANMNASHVETRRFVNPVVFACFYNPSGNKTELIKKLNEVSASGSDLIKAMDIYNLTYSIPAAGWTYSTDLKADGGQSEPAGYEWKAGDRDLSKYLTDDRFIRVLCEYKDIDENENPIKNTQHIMWHMNRVYRDQSVVGEQKSHIEDLRDSLKENDWDHTWPDGTTLQDVWDAEAAAAATAQAASNLLASALPEKRQLAA